MEKLGFKKPSWLRELVKDEETIQINAGPYLTPFTGLVADISVALVITYVVFVFALNVIFTPALSHYSEVENWFICCFMWIGLIVLPFKTFFLLWGNEWSLSHRIARNLLGLHMSVVLTKDKIKICKLFGSKTYDLEPDSSFEHIKHPKGHHYLGYQNRAYVVMMRMDSQSEPVRLETVYDPISGVGLGHRGEQLVKALQRAREKTGNDQFFTSQTDSKDVGAFGIRPSVD